MVMGRIVIKGLGEGLTSGDTPGLGLGEGVGELGITIALIKNWTPERVLILPAVSVIIKLRVIMTFLSKTPNCKDQAPPELIAEL